MEPRSLLSKGVRMIVEAMIVEAIFGLFLIIGLAYFVFVRMNEKKEEKFEKRKW